MSRLGVQVTSLGPNKHDGFDAEVSETIVLFLLLKRLFITMFRRHCSWVQFYCASLEQRRAANWHSRKSNSIYRQQRQKKHQPFLTGAVSILFLSAWQAWICVISSIISNALIVKETNQIGHVWHHSPDHLYQDYFVTQYIIFASLWEFSFRLASSRIFHTTISSPSARFEHKT